MVIYVDEYIESAFVITDGRCPYSVSINAFITFQMKIRS